jgi:hypothetical protein
MTSGRLRHLFRNVRYNGDGSIPEGITRGDAGIPYGRGK